MTSCYTYVDIELHMFIYVNITFCYVQKLNILFSCLDYKLYITGYNNMIIKGLDNYVDFNATHLPISLSANNFNLAIPFQVTIPLYSHIVLTPGNLVPFPTSQDTRHPND